MPAICVQRRSADSCARPALTDKNESKNIPVNFPMIRPKIIPSALLLTSADVISCGNLMAVFASAKMGRMTNATG